jgi:hypothetical protein
LREAAPPPVADESLQCSDATRKCLGLIPNPGRGVCLQTAFLNEARPDRRNVRLGIAKRVRRRMDRVVPQDEIVLVRSGRAENELGIGQRFEFDRFARRLESREVPVSQFVRRRQDARCDGDPEDGVTTKRKFTKLGLFLLRPFSGTDLRR